MCGIAGIVDSLPQENMTRLLQVMLNRQISRGPDEMGSHVEPGLAMGMRRLSVIDLAHGQQPARSMQGRILAFQNGEIYNHADLRRSLSGADHEFRSHCDTEVLAHGYAHWGMGGLLQRLDGMFAIAILDQRERMLHLARDPFGEKPLFYASANGRFAWSSNLLALATLSWVDSSTDLQAQDDYLALHYVPGPGTIFRGVRRLLPGHRMTVSLDDVQPKIERYFSQSLEQRPSVADAELESVLRHAVESRLAADVPVGIFLSGGLDSSLVAAFAAASHSGIRTFSMGFDTNAHDESAYARLVAHHVGSNHHEFRFSSDAFGELVPKVASALDEPLGDQAALPLYWLSQEARQHVKVVLSGEGADELFAGYSYYRSFAPANLRQRMVARLKGSAHAPGALTTLTRNAQPTTPSGFPLLADAHERQQLASHDFTRNSQWEGTLMTWLSLSADPLQRAMAADLATWLPDNLLVKLDRMTMAHSLEGRAPYLQRDLVNMALTGLRNPDRIDKAGCKRALHRVARKWLPQSILQRRKQGFVLPMRSWLASWFENHGGVSGYFAARPLNDLDPAHLIQLVSDDISRGIQRERLLFALVMYAEWSHHSRSELEANHSSKPAGSLLDA